MKDLQVWLDAIINQYDRKRSVSRIISLEEKLLVGVGENYMSQVKKLVVQAVRGDGEIVTQSFILKKMPAGTNIRAWCLEGGFNFTEFTIYRDVLSSMDLLLKEKGISDEPLWPECITMKPYEKILFEDLTTRGYKMADRLKGLDLEHCTLVVQNLGLFHALSLVMKERGVLSSVVFSEHGMLRMRKNLKHFIDGRYEKLLSDIETWGDEWIPALGKMKARQHEYSDLIFDLLKQQEHGFTVLNHGDDWTNNFLFKYNVYSGKPLFMRFLDFQLSFLGSPAHDLIYFLTSSPNLDVRRHHEKELVGIYYESLLFNMNRLGVTEKPPSFEYIENEMKRLTYMRFYLMTTLVAIISKKPEDACNIDDILEEMKEANERGEAPNMAALMSDTDDNLRAIQQVIVKISDNEGAL